MSYQAIATRIRRALRNETGATFSNEELRELTHAGVLLRLSKLEIEELCPSETAGG